MLSGNFDVPRNGDVRITRSVAKIAVFVALSQTCGCGHGPRNFRKIQNPAPLTRARAVGLGGRKADSQVVPALFNRLDDPDPVVRLAAHEELRTRTGQDFGYVPWESPEERASAIARWRAWLTRSEGGAVMPSTQSPVIPAQASKAYPRAAGAAPDP
jgi:hypothetical protein